MAKNVALSVITLFPLFWLGSCLAGWFANDALSKASTLPASTSNLSHIPLISTPFLRPTPHPKLMAWSPGPSSTEQPTQSSQQGLKHSASCSADARLINPAHAQVLSATTLTNWRSTPPTSSLQSACHPILTNAPA
ncbi:PREDICTED: uncharacterized protein LOC107337180 [Acropora digitifera]|uniref:uncharacterized protein LOC107337180 n=1 Tax=Acropora digitifera TaxID=70779 RepID=UPI00077A32E6|nr:PREDICTED: uncharacterized protein LOC107337180 [Acropora digitifera]